MCRRDEKICLWRRDSICFANAIHFSQNISRAWSKKMTCWVFLGKTFRLSFDQKRRQFELLSVSPLKINGCVNISLLRLTNSKLVLRWTVLRCVPGKDGAPVRRPQLVHHRVRRTGEATRTGGEIAELSFQSNFRTWLSIGGFHCIGKAVNYTRRSCKAQNIRL